VRCCKGENGPKGSPSVAPATSACPRMISTTGSFSATATIAAFKPISTPATSVRDAPSAWRSVVTTARFNCADELMLVLQWFLEPPNEAGIRLDRGSFLIIGRLANDLIAACRSHGVREILEPGGEVALGLVGGHRPEFCLDNTGLDRGSGRVAEKGTRLLQAEAGEPRRLVKGRDSIAGLDLRLHFGGQLSGQTESA